MWLIESRMDDCGHNIEKDFLWSWRFPVENKTEKNNKKTLIIDRNALKQSML